MNLQNGCALNTELELTYIVLYNNCLVHYNQNEGCGHERLFVPLG